MLRNFSSRLCAAIFGTCSLVLALSLAFTSTFGTPETTKQALADSKVYDSFSRVLADSATSTSEQNNNGLGSGVLPGVQPIQDKQALARSSEVQAAAKEAVTPQSAEQAANETLDGIYHWLDGTTAQPDFKIDVQPIRQRFLDSLTQAYDTQLTNLPVCSAAQVRQINPATIDPANLPCVPPGADRIQLRQQAVDRMVAGNSLLAQPTFTADSLPKDNQGKTAFQRASDLPKFFQFMKQLPLISGIAGLVCVVLVFLIQRRWRPSVKQLAIALFSSGISLVIIGCIVGLGLRAFMASNPLASLGGQGSGLDVVGSVVGALAGNITHVIFLWSCIYLAVGIAAWITLKLTNPHPTPPTGPAIDNTMPAAVSNGPSHATPESPTSSSQPKV